MGACVEEACAVASADGATVEPAATMRELDDLPPGLGSSMRRDVRAGREPELDTIAWAVVRTGEDHGVAAPVIARLARRVGGLPGSG